MERSLLHSRFMWLRGSGTIHDDHCQSAEPRVNKTARNMNRCENVIGVSIRSEEEVIRGG